MDNPMDRVSILRGIPGTVAERPDESSRGLEVNFESTEKTILVISSRSDG